MLIRGLALTALLALTAPAVQAQTGADLNISPKRVTFKDGERSASVYIFNQGDAPATYTVDLVDRVMLSDGQIAAAADYPGAKIASAGEYIQYTPRRITLAPKQSQSIRVRVRPPEGATGEQRTHLTVTALPSEDTGFTAQQAAEPEAGAVGLRVVALFSVSIPLIVREGPVDARAAIENVKAVTSAPGGVSLDLVRKGANSVYGDVEIYTADKLVAAVRGVAVYPEIERRTIVVPLTTPVRGGERLRIIYRDDDARPGAELATASFAAP